MKYRGESVFLPQSCSVNLELFIAMWNGTQGLSTPDIHLDIARWLNKGMRLSQKRLLLMAFRSCGKSTLVGLFCAWVLLRAPDTRILVLAADSKLAGKMVRNVKRIIEKHPLTTSLKPKKLDQWASDRFTVNRRMESRDPSMQARGLVANITGSRADIVICDDVEVPATCATPEARLALREALGEIDFILTPGGMQLYIGTPHSYDSIYNEKPDKAVGQDTIFLEGFHRMTVPIITEQGKSAWPERFSVEEIERIRTRTGPNKFESQMMLRPVSLHEARLDVRALQRYSGELEYSEAGRHPVLKLNDKLMISCSAWWDPAFAASDRKGDSSVLAVVFSDDEGNYYLHGTWYISHSSHDENDPASQQCQQVARILAENYVPSVNVEINGIGRFLPQILRREIVKEKGNTAVIEISSSTPKDARIIEGFDTLLAARMLFVHDRVFNTAFLREMREWRPGMKGKGVDDGLDAVAGAILSEPIRIRTGFSQRSRNESWRRGAHVHMADTKFYV